MGSEGREQDAGGPGDGRRPVRVDRNGALWTIWIDRPERRNAVDRPCADALSDAFRAFEADADAAVAVLAGSAGTFCAGADLRAMVEGVPNRLEPEGDGPMGPSRMRLTKPVIAAIEGHAVAGGLELACWCDLRVMASDAILGVFCRRWGVPLIDGGTVRLPRIIGLGRALDLVLTGRPVAAEEALAMGLVSRVVTPGTAVAAAQVLALELAALPQACLRADRQSTYEAWSEREDRALAAEFERGVGAVAAEGLGGARRFVDRRG